MSFVELRDLRKSYGRSAAVRGINLSVAEGEFISLLGPSGCGKTTTLRMIAGLIEPDSGSIEIAGTNVVGLPPYERNLGMVFQSYALFPHMTAAENIGFGLRMRNVPRADIVARVAAALDLVRLDRIGDRYPRQLSGGQQQRIALARALAIEPRVLLLDEPLSNLDLKLRMEMRFELKQLHRRLGITTIFVTHDQGEGLTLSDRVVVMHNGAIAQAAAPRIIYESPASRFVAEFIGEATLFDGKVERIVDGIAEVRTNGGLKLLAETTGDLATGQPVAMSVRPEAVRLLNFDEATRVDNRVDGVIEHLAYSGPSTRCIVRLNERETVSADLLKSVCTVGDRISATWDRSVTKLLQA